MSILQKEVLGFLQFIQQKKQSFFQSVIQGFDFNIEAQQAVYIFYNYFDVIIIHVKKNKQQKQPVGLHN
jgi:hypothetical protein